MYVLLYTTPINNLTSFHNVRHSDSKHVTHVTHHRKYDKASEDARATINKGNNQRVSMEKKHGFRHWRGLHRVVRTIPTRQWPENDLNNWSTLWGNLLPVSCDILGGEICGTRGEKQKMKASLTRSQLEGKSHETTGENECYFNYVPSGSQGWWNSGTTPTKNTTGLRFQVFRPKSGAPNIHVFRT